MSYEKLPASLVGLFLSVASRTDRGGHDDGGGNVRTSPFSLYIRACWAEPAILEGKWTQPLVAEVK